MNRWPSFEEYEKWVHPDCVRNPKGPWRIAQHGCLLENMVDMCHYLTGIESNLRQLRENFERWGEGEPPTPELLSRARLCVIQIACDGEFLLAYAPFLALSRPAGDFIAEKDLYEHWDRYAADLGGASPKLRHETERFIEATEKLLEGFNQLREDAHDFLTDLIRDLPSEITGDFRTARDLFSVGIDEAGGFFAGRGLESVLREIARVAKIQVSDQKGKRMSFREMDFADLAEALRRARWKSNGEAVIDKQVKALLDLLRTARNAAAHPRKPKGPEQEADWREIAKLSARAANDIWLTSKAGRRKLVNSTIAHDW